MNTTEATHPGLPPFEEVEEVLLRADADISAAETHGILSGYLCAGLETDHTYIVNAILGEEDESADDTARDCLFELYGATLNQLQQNYFEFECLIPDDEELLTLRAQALAEWSHGFLIGAGLSGLTTASATDDDIREALEQFLEISQLDYNTVEENEDDLRDFMELFEYTRLAAILIYQERVLRHTKSGVGSETLH